MPDQQTSNGRAGSTRRQQRIVRFGPYQFRPGTQELLKHGIRIKVQAKPLQILNALIERHGELVTREELCRELWPEGTFVDFESGLNTATNRLRVALNDSAEHPLYIETLPRLGYRFICPVAEVRESGTISDPNHTAVVHAGVGIEEKQHQSAPVSAPPRKTKHRAPLWIAASLALALCAAGIILKSGKQAVFQPLTYREQVIGSARFVQGANSAAFTTYTASHGPRTYRAYVNGSNIQPTAVSDGQLASVSRSGDMLIELKSPDSKRFDLLQIRADGKRKDLGADASEEVDMLPGANSLVVSRSIDSESAIEFPAGHVLYRFPGWFSDLRVSPDGQKVAFMEHPVRDDDRGHVRVLEKNGTTRVLTDEWSSAQGLAWTPNSNEIWFTASKTSAVRSLYAVSLLGGVRRVTSSPTSLHLFDISPSRQLLLSIDDMRSAMLAAFAGSNGEEDVTEFDQPHVEAMSRDGRRLLFTESGDAGGQHYSALLFDSKSHRSRLLARGRGMALSPDEHSALAIDPQDTSALTLVNLQSGVSSQISGHGIHYQWARFLSNGMLLAGGSSADGRLTLFRQSVHGEQPAPMKQYPYIDNAVVSPDGSKVAGVSGTDLTVIDFCKKNSRQLPLKEMMIPVAWSGDQRTLFLSVFGGASPAILKYDLANDSVTIWKALRTSASASVGEIDGVVTAPDADAYAYSLRQDLSRLYVVRGLS